MTLVLRLLLTIGPPTSISLINHTWVTLCCLNASSFWTCSFIRTIAQPQRAIPCCVFYYTVNKWWLKNPFISVYYYGAITMTYFSVTWHAAETRIFLRVSAACPAVTSTYVTSGDITDTVHIGNRVFCGEVMKWKVAAMLSAPSQRGEIVRGCCQSLLGYNTSRRRPDTQIGMTLISFDGSLEKHITHCA